MGKEAQEILRWKKQNPDKFFRDYPDLKVLTDRYGPSHTRTQVEAEEVACQSLPSLVSEGNIRGRFE